MENNELKITQELIDALKQELTKDEKVKKFQSANGEGTYYYDKKNNRWQYKFYVHDSIDGSIIRKTLSAKTKDEVFKKYKELMFKTNDFKFITQNGLPIIELIKKNLENRHNANDISGGYYKRTLETIKMIEKYSIAQENIIEVSIEKLQLFFNEIAKKYSDSTIKKVWEQFNQGFKFAIKNKYIQYNLMEDLIKSKSQLPTKEVTALTLEEQQKLAKYLLKSTLNEEKYKNVFLLQMYLGLRVGETLALKNSDINLDKNIVKISRTLTQNEQGKIIMGNTTKTSTGKRQLPIPPFLKEIIKEQIDVSNNNQYGLLFSYNDSYVHPHSINSQLKRILKNLDIKRKGLSTHVLRHTYATRSIEAGMPAVVLQKLMGHSDVKITLNTYTSVFDDFKFDEINKVSMYYVENNLLDEDYIKNTKDDDLYLREDIEEYIYNYQLCSNF